MECAAVIFAILIVVVAVVAYVVWRRTRRPPLGSPANCVDYPTGDQGACKTVLGWCKSASDPYDQKACAAAIRACMPAVRGTREYNTAKASGNNPSPVTVFNHLAPHYITCAKAMSKMSPKGAAEIMHTSIVDQEDDPSEDTDRKAFISFFGDPNVRRTMHDAVEAAPDALEWAYETGDHLYRQLAGDKKSSFTAGPGGLLRSRAPPAPVAGIPGALRPVPAEGWDAAGQLRPVATGRLPGQCFADANCGPAGSCAPRFVDDPTYGGGCVPA